MSTAVSSAPKDTATRRLWFLQILLGKVEPEKALSLASRMEAFVATGETLPKGRDENHGPIAPRRLDRARAGSAATAAGGPSEAFQQAPEIASVALGAEGAASDTGEERGVDADRAPSSDALAGSLVAPTARRAGEVWRCGAAAPESSPKTPRGETPGSLLTSGELQEFQDRALKGATNRDLAQRFGLTPRQANGIRMALAKRVPQVALKRVVAKAPKVSLDRATELQMQSAFLQQKTQAPPTVEDVVRYLRQRGDVVTRSGEAFSVNYRLVLSEEELVRRANEKRARFGLPAFGGDKGLIRPAVDTPRPEPIKTGASDR